jgi:hypothetical protein
MPTKPINTPVRRDVYRKCLRWMRDGIDELTFFNRLSEELKRTRDMYRAHAIRRYHANADHVRAISRKSYHKTAIQRREDARKYRERLKSDPEKLRAHNLKTTQRILRRMESDPVFKLKCTIRTRIGQALRMRYKKSAKTFDLLGCTIEQLVAHLESQWTVGMSWETYGFRGWHVDHRIPCHAFDLSNPEEQKTCFHYTNLQPMWWRDNIAKGTKILPEP